MPEDKEKHRYKIADLNGFALVPPPSTLPEAKVAMSLTQAVRLAVDDLWPKDEKFRERSNSVSNATAQTKSYHGDKTMMALTIMEWAKANKVSVITSLEDEAIGLMRGPLRKVMEERGQSRQQVLARAIEARIAAS